MIWENSKRKRIIKRREWHFATEDDTPSYEEQLTMTEDEIEASTAKYMLDYHKAVDTFEKKTSLNGLDISIMLVAAALQVTRWIILSNGSYRFNKATDADHFIENSAKKIAESPYVPTTIQDIAASIEHRVPYDAIVRSERFKSIYINETTHLGGRTHRVNALGHDPLAGLIVGTANIATNTLTVNDIYSGFPSYHILNQHINAKTDLGHIMGWTIDEFQKRPQVVGGAFARQVVHLGTDAFTPQGIPLPIINNISPEYSQFLINNKIDFYSVTRGMMFAVLINKLIEMFHRLFADKTKIDDEEYMRLYEVKTRKIILYSNTLSSVLNVAFATATNNYKMLDIGGLIVTFWEFISKRKKMEEIKADFIRKTLDNEFKKEEDTINEKLAPYGYAIDNISINKIY